MSIRPFIAADWKEHFARVQSEAAPDPINPTPACVVKVLRSYLGTPYGHMGRDVGHKLDCVGMLIAGAKELRIPHTDPVAYPPRGNGELLVRFLRKSLTEVSLDEVQPGCILAFRLDDEQMHAGLLTVHPTGKRWAVIHAFRTKAGKGKVAEHIFNDKWQEITEHAFLLQRVSYNHG